MRVLLVEDEFFVAALIEDDLRAAGHEIVGPYKELAKAIEATRSERFDVAVLDVNLNGAPVYPLADELLARGIPFVFLSGYVELPERFKATPRIGKPHNPAALIAALRKIGAPPG
jgi:DNA-binding response OmpR family regulator